MTSCILFSSNWNKILRQSFIHLGRDGRCHSPNWLFCSIYTWRIFPFSTCWLPPAWRSSWFIFRLPTSKDSSPFSSQSSLSAMLSTKARLVQQMCEHRWRQYFLPNKPTSQRPGSGLGRQRAERSLVVVGLNTTAFLSLCSQVTNFNITFFFYCIEGPALSKDWKTYIW